MTMNSSGPISLAGTTAGVSIEIENGGNGTTQISLNDAAVRSLAGVPSGAIIMPTNFYGKANQFSFSITANTSNVNLRSAALTAGWNGSSALQATINSGVVVYSTSTGSYAMTVNGSFPGGVTLVNNGTILGAGGRGGDGGGNPGNAAGPALLVSSAVTINNAIGRIAGGGGGGGGGNNNSYCVAPSKTGCTYSAFDGGCGGGGGIGNGAGGMGIPGPTNQFGENGTPGSAGTLTSAGSGGTRSYYSTAQPGAAGGSYGATGSGASGGGGGAGGAAVVGNSNITWTAFGTRNGSIS